MSVDESGRDACPIVGGIMNAVRQILLAAAALIGSVVLPMPGQAATPCRSAAPTGPLEQMPAAAIIRAVLPRLRGSVLPAGPVTACDGQEIKRLDEEYREPRRPNRVRLTGRARLRDGRLLVFVELDRSMTGDQAVRMVSPPSRGLVAVLRRGPRALLVDLVAPFAWDGPSPGALRRREDRDVLVLPGDDSPSLSPAVPTEFPATTSLATRSPVQALRHRRPQARASGDEVGDDVGDNLAAAGLPARAVSSEARV